MPKFDSVMKLQTADAVSVLDEVHGGLTAKGLALSTRHAVEFAIGPEVERWEEAERVSVPFIDGAVRAIARKLKEVFTGDEANGDMSHESAAAEPCDISDLPLRNADAKGADGKRETSTEGRLAMRRSDSIFSGGAAVHDGNLDPLIIAFSQKDKGGPPHIFSMFGASEAFASTHQKSSDEKVLAARSQGDAQDHHGEQDDDDRGGRNMGEDDSEEELIA